MKEKKVRKRWEALSKGDSRGREIQKTVRAHTKSEARAIFKKILKGPIPKHWLIAELPV